ncbi:MAG: hypothetical protein EOM91_15220 [Sphingobacteriia bacterium]|nr:hypothetical protein [Sphingobacteriia bacterium]NCC40515.1 hypothetical protein [Gammaproteobacteria bacterium]
MSVIGDRSSGTSIHWQRLMLALGVLLLTLTLIRLGAIFPRDIFTDYLAYTDTTQAIMAGANPYDLESMRYRTWGEAPIVFPGYVVFFQWIAQDAPGFKPWYILGSMLLFLSALLLFLRRTALREAPSGLPDAQTFLIYSIMLFVFFNASPVLKTLRLGQSTPIIFFAFFMLLLCNREWCRYLMLASIAIMKYSMLTIWAPLLFFKKYYQLCIIGFLIFLLAALYPVIYFPDILTLFKSYVREVALQTTEQGFNTYSVSGFDMVHLDVIKNAWAATTLKLLFIAGGIALFLRERKTPGVSFNLLFSAGCLTMLISYHRLHDLVVLLPFLLVLAHQFMVTRRYLMLGICAAFLLYFLIPESILFPISSALGGQLGGLEQWIHLNRYDDNVVLWQQMLPTPAIVMPLMTLFAYYVNIVHPSPYRFELGSPSADVREP